MKEMRILIPMADGHTLSNEILRGITMQTYSCEILPITRPMIIANKRISEAECRNLLRMYAVGDIICMMDRSVIFTSPTDIEDAVEALNQRKEYDILAYNVKTHKKIDDLKYDITNNHIEIGCMFIRSEVLQKIEFGQPPNRTDSCLCVKVNQDAKIGWVD